MATKNIKISDSAKEELRAATITDTRLDLVGQVKNYAELKKIFQAIGVVWNKKDKTHYFEGDARETIDFILNGGQIVDKKRTLQAFYTPPELAAQVVELAEVSGMRVLEPSCGEGALVKECFAQGAKFVTGVEINSELKDFWVDFLNGFSTTTEVRVGVDFLQEEINIVYDRVVMNPPFDKNLWVKHIQHAWKFLREDGRLVAICPNAEHNKFFQKFIADKVYEIHPVEAGAFKESGTNIATMIVVINK
jgi:predicted RNA methylase